MKYIKTYKIFESEENPTEYPDIWTPRSYYYWPEIVNFIKILVPSLSTEEIKSQIIKNDIIKRDLDKVYQTIAVSIVRLITRSSLPQIPDIIGRLEEFEVIKDNNVDFISLDSFLEFCELNINTDSIINEWKKIDGVMFNRDGVISIHNLRTLLEANNITYTTLINTRILSYFYKYRIKSF